MRKMSSDAAPSNLLPRLIHPFSLVIPPTIYCPGSDVEGEVLLKFPQMHDEQIEEVVVEFGGRMKVSVSHRSCSDRVPYSSPLGLRKTLLSGNSCLSRNPSGSEDPPTLRRTRMSSECRSTFISPLTLIFYHRCSGSSRTMACQSCTISK